MKQDKDIEGGYQEPEYLKYPTLIFFNMNA